MLLGLPTEILFQIADHAGPRGRRVLSQTCMILRHNLLSKASYGINLDQGRELPGKIPKHVLERLHFLTIDIPDVSGIPRRSKHIASLWQRHNKALDGNHGIGFDLSSGEPGRSGHQGKRHNMVLRGAGSVVQYDTIRLLGLPLTKTGLYLAKIAVMRMFPLEFLDFHYHNNAGLWFRFRPGYQYINAIIQSLGLALESGRFHKLRDLRLTMHERFQSHYNWFRLILKLPALESVYLKGFHSSDWMRPDSEEPVLASSSIRFLQLEATHLNQEIWPILLQSFKKLEGLGYDHCHSAQYSRICDWDPLYIALELVQYQKDSIMALKLHSHCDKYIGTRNDWRYVLRELTRLRFLSCNWNGIEGLRESLKHPHDDEETPVDKHTIMLDPSWLTDVVPSLETFHCGCEEDEAFVMVIEPTNHALEELRVPNLSKHLVRATKEKNIRLMNSTLKDETEHSACGLGPWLVQSETGEMEFKFH